MNNIYYRGYDSKYGVFDSNNNESFTWLTDSLNYALWYSHNQENGKVAKIKLNTDKLLNLEGQNFSDDTDPIDTDDSNMKEFVYSKGFDGVIFTAPEGNYKIIAVRKDKCQIVESVVNIKGIKDIWGEGLKESNNYDIYYRGYDGNFSPLDNNNSYIWLTNSYEYAAQYTEEKSNGKVAKIALLTTKLGTLNNLADNIDYFDPGDDTMEDYIYSQGMDGYTFELEDNTLVVCVNKNKVKVLDSDYKENINEAKITELPTFNQVEQALKDSEPFKVSKEPTDTGFILPDGLFVNTSDDNINGWHCDLEDYLEDNKLSDSNSEKISQKNDNGYGAPSLEKFGAIRISEGEEYVCLPPVKPTEAAYSSLLAWLDKYIKDSNKYLPSGSDLQVTNYDGNQYQEYSIKENTADDILKKIKHYFTSGKLVESKLKEFLLFHTPELNHHEIQTIIDYVKSQHTVSDVYTGDAMYLAPDGEFIDMGKYHSQEDMIDCLSNMGLIPDSYFDSGDVVDLEDNFAENVLGFVHCGNDSYSYVGFPAKQITNAQYKALESVEQYYINAHKDVDIEVYVGGHDKIPTSELFYDDATDSLHDKYDNKSTIEKLMRQYYKTGKFNMVESINNKLPTISTIEVIKEIRKLTRDQFYSLLNEAADDFIINPNDLSSYDCTLLAYDGKYWGMEDLSHGDFCFQVYMALAPYIAKKANKQLAVSIDKLDSEADDDERASIGGDIFAYWTKTDKQLIHLDIPFGIADCDAVPNSVQFEQLKAWFNVVESISNFNIGSKVQTFSCSDKNIDISSCKVTEEAIETIKKALGIQESIIKPKAKLILDESLNEEYTKEVNSAGMPLSAEQAHYFRNSKVRDDKGNLLVCYHGTEKANFLTFNPVGKGAGNYKYKKAIVNFFAANKNMAYSYAGTHDDANTKMPSDKAGIYNVYLNIVSPYVFDAGNSNWRGLHDTNIRKEQLQRYNDFIKEWNVKRIQYIEDNISKLNAQLKMFGYVLKKDPEGFGGNEYELFSTYEGGHFEPPDKRVSIDYGLTEVNDLLDSEAWKEDILGDGSSEKDEDNYYQTTNDIVTYALNKNREAGYPVYDGVIIKNVIDSGQYGFGDDGDIYITIVSPNQVKSIHNLQPTVGQAINESENIVDSEGKKLTENQLKYFKDSKVRDEAGHLAVVYHGTKSDFKEFKTDSGLYYFSYDKDYASGYADSEYGHADGDKTKILSCYLKAKNILDLTDLGVDYSWWVETTNDLSKTDIDYENEVNGRYMNDSDEDTIAYCEHNYGSYKGWVPCTDFVELAKRINVDWRDLADYAIILIKNGQTTSCSISTIENSKEFRQLLINAGYDAFVQEETEGTAIAVVDANQIKLTSNTNPTSGNRIDEADFDFDYGTGNVVGDNIFDTKQLGGFSEYEQTIPGNKWYQYMIDEKNLKGEIVQMSPEEYFRRCAVDIFNHNGNDSVTSPEELKKNRGYEIDEIKKLEKIITDRKKQFPMCFIDYAHYGQEGLHRMYAAGELFGWNHKFPVLVIDWADKDKQAAYEKDKKLREITYKVNTAVDKALRYKGYSSLDEFKDQLYTELEDQFYETTSFDLKTDEKNDKFTVTVKDVTVERPYSKINFADNSNESLKESDVSDAVDKYLYKTQEPKPGSCYLMPNGTFLFCDANTKLGTHEDHAFVVANQSGLNADDVDGYINDGGIALNSDAAECRVDYVKQPTAKQYEQLLNWLYYVYQDLGNDRVEIQDNINHKWHQYLFKDTLPEDIIKNIQHSFTSKSLAEDTGDADWKKNLLNCVLYWFKNETSTKPIQRCFIMPDGKYIKTLGEEDDDMHYHTEQFIRNIFFYDRDEYTGELKPDYDNAAFKALGLNRKQIEDIQFNIPYNGWSGGSIIMELILGAMRCNGGGEHYIVIPDNPLTSAQYASLTAWLDIYYAQSTRGYISVCTRGFDGGFNGQKQQNYYTEDLTSDEVIKRIKQYYAYGELREDESSKVYKLPEKTKKYADDWFTKSGYKFDYETVSADKLMKDNDLNNPDNLSNHEELWGTDPSAYVYKQTKDSNIHNFPYLNKKSDKLVIGDGRHRIRALINAGYDSFELPTILK